MQVQHLICETNGCGQQSQKVQKATIITTGNNSPAIYPHEQQTRHKKVLSKEFLPKVKLGI